MFSIFKVDNIEIYLKSEEPGTKGTGERKRKI